MDSKQELSEYLKQKLRGYLDSGKSLGQVSNATKISKSTLSRYASDESPKEPRAAVVFRFLSFFHSASESAKMMKKAYPEWIESYGESNSSQNSKIVSQRDSYIEYTRDHDKIFSMIDFNSGISKEEFLIEFGRQGLEKIQDLIDEGFVAFDGRKYILGDLTDCSNINILVPMMKAQFDCIQNDALGKSILMWHNREAYPESVAKDIANASMSYVKEIRHLTKIAKESDQPKTHYAKTSILVDWSLDSKGEGKDD